MKARLRAIVLLLLVLIVAIAGAVWRLHQFADSKLNIRQAILFTLPAGSSSEALANKLYNENIINQTVWLRWLVHIYPNYAKFKAGTYRLTPEMTVRDLLQLLHSGKEAQLPIRFAEGARLSELLAQLRAAPCIRHTLKNDDYSTLAASLGMVPEQLEGNFWPDTWLYTANTHDVALLQRAYQRMQQELDAIWEHRDSHLPYKNRQQLLIMASLIEKETALPDERPLIASVFINRLRIGMRLQTDPTVIYGIGKHYRGNITRKDLQTPTPYNTYIISGLPPTPIASPGKASLQAAAHPAHSNYLYFVANGKGGHTFSRNLAEHNAAVRAYLNWLKQRQRH